MTKRIFTACVQRDLEQGGYVASFPGIGVFTQAETLDELQEMMQNALALGLKDLEPEDIDLIPESAFLMPVEVSL
jgi:predicted RNase H-like HicB family nuclease